ncbi:MAG: MFS transporter [Chloroflexota bacterium]
MIKKNRRTKIFFGWWTVLTGGILGLWVAGYHAYGFSALFKPIASELGFSRAVASVPSSIGRLEGGIEGPVAGWITDKFGPKWVVLSGVVLFSLGLILMNYINSIWAFYLVWGVIVGTGHNIATTVPIDTAISNWFVKKRGVALSIRWVLSGLSGVLVLPLIAWLISTVGWRMTCVIGGMVMAVVGLPLTWFFLKQHRPEYYGMLPDGATAADGAAETPQMIDRGVKYAAEVREVEFTLRQAMRTRTYWLMILVWSIYGLVMQGINVHSIPFLTDFGIEPVRAASVVAVMILASLPSRFIAGFFIDRVRTEHLPFLVTGAYALQAAGILIFLLYQTTAAIYLWFVLYGFGMGAGIALSSPMRARYFGRKAFGSIHGSSQMFATPAGVIAPIYVGWVYDTTGSYMSVFVLFAVALGIASVLIIFARPPRPPAQVTDIRRIV